MRVLILISFFLFHSFGAAASPGSESKTRAQIKGLERLIKKKFLSDHRAIYRWRKDPDTVRPPLAQKLRRIYYHLERLHLKLSENERGRWYGETLRLYGEKSVAVKPPVDHTARGWFLRAGGLQRNETYSYRSAAGIKKETAGFIGFSIGAGRWFSERLFFQSEMFALNSDISNDEFDQPAAVLLGNTSLLNFVFLRKNSFSLAAGAGFSYRRLLTNDTSESNAEIKLGNSILPQLNLEATFHLGRTLDALISAGAYGGGTNYGAAIRLNF
jgi:hypothetical protein